MSNLKRLDRSTALPVSFFQHDQLLTYYNIQECRVRLIRDPLLIPKEEIEEENLPSSVITLSEIINTTAEVFIEASTTHQPNITETDNYNSTRAKYKCSNCSKQFSSFLEFTQHKEMHVARKKINVSNNLCSSPANNENYNGEDNGDENVVLDGRKTLNNKTGTNIGTDKARQHKYRCHICDDICSNELEFKIHLEFHLELSKDDECSNKLEVHAANVASSVCENIAAMSNSSDKTSNKTDNSKGDGKAEAIAVNVPSSSSYENTTTSSAPQSEEKIFNSSLSPNNERSDPKPSTSAAVNPSRTKKSSCSTLLPKKRIKKSTVFTSPEICQLPKIPREKCACPKKTRKNRKDLCELCIISAKYVCANCQKGFKSFKQLTEHFSTSHKTSKYICQQCGRGYTKKTTLKRHMDRHKGLSACSVCSISFKTKGELAEHLWVHKVKCDQCGKICASKSDLTWHKKDVHKGLVYKCDPCNKTFNRYFLLQYHKQRYHSGIEYKCKECGKIYQNYKSYTEHIFYKHSQGKYVLCEECGKEFKSNKYLQAHSRAVHLKKKYECNVCNKEFSTTIGRSNCQNKHAGVAKYKCDMCEKAYYYEGSLLIHKRIHTGEKPYVCFICSRRFYNRQTLFKHGLSHGISEDDLKRKLKTSYQPEKKE